MFIPEADNINLEELGERVDAHIPMPKGDAPHCATVNAKKNAVQMVIQQGLPKMITSQNLECARSRSEMAVARIMPLTSLFNAFLHRQTNTELNFLC